ncbi:glycogen synthase [Tannerella sp. oral taxon 808]|nr:glycogen synthase [Tannerella sp. oral taxon 808]
MDAKRILFITQEVMPYIPETPIGNISRHLPQGVQERGYEIRTFMPKYGCINERRNQLHEVIRLSGMNLIIDDTDHPLVIKVASIQMARMQVYFIDNEDFFHRKAALTDEKGNGFPDNDERTVFFIRGVFETIHKLRWMPDIIHCHGWFSALASLLLKRKYFDDPCFARSKVIYSLYDQEFHPALNSRIARKLKLEGATDRDIKLLEGYDYIALNKLAIKHADGIIMGSPTIDSQLEEFITQNKKKILPYQDPENYIEAYDAFYQTIAKKK